MNAFLLWLWLVPGMFATGFLGAAVAYYPCWYYADKRHGNQEWYRDWRRGVGPKRKWFK